MYLNNFSCQWLFAECDGELEESEDEGLSSSEETGSGSQCNSDEDEDEIPVYLWRPSQTTDKMADWEKHTKVKLILLFNADVTQAEIVT